MNISLQQFAAMNMVYNRYSFSYFLDSMQRLNVSNFELWTGAPHLNCMFQTMADAASVRKSRARAGTAHGLPDAGAGHVSLQYCSR